MPVVKIPTPLRGFAAGRAAVPLGGSTVSALLEELLADTLYGQKVLGGLECAVFLPVLDDSPRPRDADTIEFCGNGLSVCAVDVHWTCDRQRRRQE